MAAGVALASLGQHAPGQVDPGQDGRRPASLHAAQQAPGAAADIQHGRGRKAGRQAPQHATVDAVEEEPLGDVPLIVLGPVIEVFAFVDVSGAAHKGHAFFGRITPVELS